MDIFVINMERATERREHILAHLRDLGLKAEILPAVEGARVLPEALPPGTHPDLSAGEIGCYLSHVRFWETVVARGLDHAIVLEDDVRCSPNLMEIVHQVLASGVPFDAVRLSALRPIRGEPLAILPGGARIVLPTKNPSGTQGYLVSQTGARRMLQRLNTLSCPIDDTLDLYWRHGLRIPVLTPTVVEEDPNLASTIVGRYGSSDRKTFLRHLARVAMSQRRKLTVKLMARQLRAEMRRQREAGR